jgi:hypothetical protein
MFLSRKRSFDNRDIFEEYNIIRGLGNLVEFDGSLSLIAYSTRLTATRAL